jgi:hypothetical protein
MSLFYPMTKGLLWVVILIGLWGALSVSYNTIMRIDPCPDILNIPICYLVSMGYLLMLGAQFISSGRLKNQIFYSGWGITLLIAGFGVGFELVAGNVCPRSEGGLPLCYISFIFCVLIFVLFRLTAHWEFRGRP